MTVISKAMREKVEKYVELYSEMKAIEAQLKEMRPEIEEYMAKKGANIIEARNGSVQRSMVSRPNTSAVYTTYHVSVVSVLSAEAASECLETVIDRDKLDHLVKIGKADRKLVDQYKMSKSVPLFKTKPGITSEVR